MKYKRLMDKKWVDVKEYVLNYLQQHKDAIVYIGCDSQHFGDKLKYATVIVLYREGKGGHVLYYDEILSPIKELKVKLLGEVKRSVEIATYLQYECGINVKEVELDLNSDDRYDSNTALKEAVGWVSGMGFSYKQKPDELCAIPAANKLCR